ncbi:MAG TPA: hypothetical protein VN105_12395, partial [Chitinophaga sp.]|nr:hypothetical protein [Chitinophaga sp.]
MNSRSLFLAGVFFVGRNFIATGQDTLKLTLSEAWRKAEAHSRIIEINRKATEIAEEEIRDTRVERLPEIGVSGSAE